MNIFIWTIFFGILGSLAGGSFPYSRLLNSKDKGGIMPVSLTQLPEILMALLVGYSAITLYEAIWGDFTFIMSVIIWLLASLTSYGGIQAATYGMLYWQNGGEEPKDRKAKIKPIVDLIAKWRGYKYGDEGYAWIWAGVKGFITTLPIGGFGAILFPLGFEAGSHAQGRISGDTNLYREFLSYAGIGLIVSIVIKIVGN